MQKQWTLKPSASHERIEELAKAINVSNPIANLLLQRGITSYEEARRFFRPDLKFLHDPFLMKDMDLAVSRLGKAVQNQEHVMVYGDYDVDGTTSVAMLFSFLRSKIRQLHYYIPDRYLEGYGISYKGIDAAQELGCSLIIALDCGIKATQKVDYANEKDIDFIICDHHEPGEYLPKAVAVLDPKRPDCQYPFKELSACGVGFKLIQAYALRNEIPFYKIEHYLDLVVVSIASDIVPIVDENRIMAYYGLKRLNSKPRIGLKAIMDVAGAEPGNLKINDLVFKVGPRINAAGRMEQGRYSVDLLVCKIKEHASAMAGRIDDDNTERKWFDNNITKEALAFLEENPEFNSKKSTVLYNPEWHKGVIGIVASRLIDYHYKPTIVLTKSNGFINGSARSVHGFNLYQAVEKCQHLLENFGGHMYAAGLTLKEENLELFKECFEQAVCDFILPDSEIQRIEADAEISLGEIRPRFYKVLEQFEPYGPGNMTPVFIARDVIDTGYAQCVGSDCEHLRLYLTDSQTSSSFAAIAFRQAQFFGQIKDKQPFDICFNLDENTYKGKTSIQIKIRDIQTNTSVE
ncbi:MAG TPA: single-stranded-DNA-specific exonuclease RecJ [Marinilabiliales bacterium]|nr:MAG: single-stranded-DNA-specific exonuclease RecJ [Bacteroidetes bacterium GWA2_40_14]OFX74323.1 MAG: single-stranded-DNA-specific exonuclease RecJ [Bacteroidetes bacterium GWD2_40_43]OFX90942.1 MAG: single-stranded-DNA-specific exonuclease RecJ [Bacteroidetes bacterium GWE2_40_63]OFY21156.1 MAG: single-stranded-DNA-specific exonuclease RecJ [Bacteroidetes bacterium GWF2_40_13]OFZ25384.1 MAG: single-stranded-DNA-specific exonuclease RecJ [Bacteroidetes bacterium RIFOXYC2_FULL_40_12]HAM9879